MNIYEVQTRTPLLIQNLLDIWEKSVRATHLFLSDAEIEQLKAGIYTRERKQGAGVWDKKIMKES